MISSSITNKDELYHKYVDRADRLYKKDRFYLAYQDYKVALKIIPTGKKANFGLAYSLNKLCERQHIYCDESISYATAMENWE